LLGVQNFYHESRVHLYAQKSQFKFIAVPAALHWGALCLQLPLLTPLMKSGLSLNSQLITH